MAKHKLSFCVQRYVKYRLNSFLQIMQRHTPLHICYKRFRIFACVCALIACYCFIWFLSHIRFGSEFVKTDRLYVCLADRIKPFTRKIADLSALVIRPEDSNPKAITFVGNGFIGCSFQYNKLMISHAGFLSKSLDLSALITLDMHGYLSDASCVLDIEDGIMHKMNCFKHENELCVSSGTMVYAHRIHTSLLVQNFLVYNPLDEDVTVKVNKAHIKNLKGIKTTKMISLKQQNLPADTVPRDVAYQVISILLDEDASAPDLKWENSTRRVIVVVLFEPVFPDAFTVPSGRTHSYSFITGVRASANAISVTKQDLAHAASDHGVIGRERRRLESAIYTELAFALQHPEAQLRALHIAAWNRLWLSGVTLSYSHAAKALNGDQINATLYYLAANTPDYLSRDTGGNRTALELYLLRFPKRATCEPLGDLLHSTKHWGPVRTTEQLSDLVVLWHSTLHRSQCSAFFDDGAHGILQAALLLIGSFRFHAEFVSFSLPSETPNRDMKLRRIQLDHPGVYVNVELQIVPGELSLSSPHLMVVELSAWRSRPPPALRTMVKGRTPNLPVIAQPLDPQVIAPIEPQRSKEGTGHLDVLLWAETEAEAVPVFVCPTACLQTPVQVGYHRVRVPYLVTTPPSAAMYFGTQGANRLQEHVHEMNYGEVRPGPNPNHDLITLHRHGHAFGGLPWLFWISLGLLITLFHLFFCKIIYNELIRDPKEIDAENSWNIPKHALDLRAPGATTARALIKAELLSRRRYNIQSDSIP